MPDNYFKIIISDKFFQQLRCRFKSHIIKKDIFFSIRLKTKNGRYLEDFKKCGKS